MGVLSSAFRIFLEILTALVLVRILMSWFRPRYRTSGNSWFYRLEEIVYRATEPMLAPIRNILPGGGMGMDFSPMILLLILQLVGSWIVQALVQARL
jgi:YggT family protein